MCGVVPPMHHVPSWSGQGQPYVYFTFVFVFVCLFTHTYYAHVHSLTELAGPRENAFCNWAIVLHTKLWSRYNCCKRFMTWQLIIRHVLLICITSHTQRVCVFPVRYFALFSCLRKIGDKFTAVRVLVPTNAPKLGDSDLRDFWVKNICCGLVGWYQRFVRTRFLHLQRQHAPPQRWQH
jgi:hypothetical protein